MSNETMATSTTTQRRMSNETWDKRQAGHARTQRRMSNETLATSTTTQKRRMSNETLASTTTQRLTPNAATTMARNLWPLRQAKHRDRRHPNGHRRGNKAPDFKRRKNKKRKKNKKRTEETHTRP